MHPVDLIWDRLIRQIGAEMLRRDLHPARVVILLPFAQLVPQARSAWSRACAAGLAQAHFLPRFETSMSWARSLGGFEPAADDLRLDAARDVLTAASLLSRAGLAAQQTLLAGRLMETAWSLARIAAAVPATGRAQWGLDLGVRLAAALDSPPLALEAAVARIALAWATHSNYASDRLFSASPDLLVVLEGFQAEPMTSALQQALPERLLRLMLSEPEAGGEMLRAATAARAALHAAQDAEDEAQRAAACVLVHLAAGRSPVALVAQDRLLTRRVHAMLAQLGVAVHDETGWRLSTTRAAASLMSLLVACAWDAATDAVLDWLKNAPAIDQDAVLRGESNWRRMGFRDWRSVPAGDDLVTRVQEIRQTLQVSRRLSRWLANLRAALQDAGQWSGLLQDPAGQAVLDALRLREGAEAEFMDIEARMSLSQFTAWAGQALEGMSFSPAHPAQAQVVILPLSQLLGRPLAALVLPGCDEQSLAVSPEPPGFWTPALRALLGLPSREQLSGATRACWQYALNFPHADILWRQSEGGERVMASSLVQELQLQYRSDPPPDPRPLRGVDSAFCRRPAPRGDALPVDRLSATAYEDLRRCPYRFFALRQLRLQAPDELDLELDKRDFGNWLHHLLRLFHEALQRSAQVDPAAREAMLNAAAEQATAELGLSNSEFLPFVASWPRVRSGYLAWLIAHEASGAIFDEAEAWREVALGRLALVGKIDRVDRLADGSALVIDYKTEAPALTAQRIKAGLEDTQLAFYAALLTDDTLAAAYLNVGEKDGSKSYAQTDIVALRDQLLEGIASDMARISGGEPMPALGEGKACEYCAARGLCRKDFWAPQ
ncbi:MAG: PD-(D/E)XK nuclease family protein [Rhodoferax sp.]